MTTTPTKPPSDDTRTRVDDFVPCSDGRRRWFARAGWREFIVGPDAIDWFALERSAHARRVKDGYGRVCWRVEVGEVAVFAKVATPTGWIDRWKNKLVGTPSRREWRALVEAERRGVPVAQAVAVGVCPESGKSVLLTRAYEPSTSLTRRWETAIANRADRRRAAADFGLVVADLVVRAHMRGVVHRDGHPNNILVCDGDASKPRAVFVDLLGAKTRPSPAPFDTLIRAIAQLDQHFHRRATRGERVRFLRHCLALTGRPTETWRATAMGVATARASWADRLARGRDRRILRNGKYFTRLDLGRGWTGVVTLELERRHLFPAHAIPDRSAAEWLDMLRPLVVTLDRLGKDTPPTTAGLSVESCPPAALAVRLTWLFVGSPSRRAFERAHRARHRDDAGDLLLGYLEHRRLGCVDRAVLLRPTPPAEAATPADKPTGTPCDG